MSKRFGIIALIKITALILVGLCCSCASTTLPPKLTPDQMKIISATSFRATVGVEEFKYPVYSKKLIKALQETHLFERVDDLGAFQEAPTFIARVERPTHGFAGIPLSTIFSLGIIPSTFEEAHGYSFSLVPTASQSEKISIEFSYEGPSTLGWWALFLNLQPNRTVGDVYKNKRMIQSLAWEILTHSDQINRFAKSAGT